MWRAAAASGCEEEQEHPHQMSRTLHGLDVHQPGVTTGKTWDRSTDRFASPLAAVLIASRATAPPGCTLAHTSTLLGTPEAAESAFFNKESWFIKGNSAFCMHFQENLRSEEKMLRMYIALLLPMAVKFSSRLEVSIKIAIFKTKFIIFPTKSIIFLQNSSIWIQNGHPGSPSHCWFTWTASWLETYGHTSNFKINGHFSIQNHHFPGEILHYLCIFNRIFRIFSALLLQLAVLRSFATRSSGPGRGLKASWLQNESFWIKNSWVWIQDSSVLNQLPMHQAPVQWTNALIHHYIRTKEYHYCNCHDYTIPQPAHNVYIDVIFSNGSSSAYFSLNDRYFANFHERQAQYWCEIRRPIKRQ